MTKIKFSEEELNIAGHTPPMPPLGEPVSIYQFPISRKQAYFNMVNHDPDWVITNIESERFMPRIVPDNIARAFVFENNTLSREEFGGKDMFGIEWVYVDIAGGSMVKPGSPLFEDANEWYGKLVWPDVDSWDWEGALQANRDYIKTDAALTTWIFTGFYERLISFMDFDAAIVAMIDEDQQDAIKDLFDKLADLYIKIVDKFITYFDIDIFTVHDDWGSQRAPFFSPATAKEMIVPYMKKLTDFIHSKGKIADLHSCGHLELQVPQIIEAGWDTWSPQPMNDTKKLFDQYGDKIILGVIPQQVAPDASEEEQRQAARDFVQEYCMPNKTAMVSFYGSRVLTPAYREEMYKQSRLKYSE